MIATAELPLIVAISMETALADVSLRIGACKYEAEMASCPISAAVNYAESEGPQSDDWDSAESDSPQSDDWDSAWGDDEDFGKQAKVFDTSFDFCAEEEGFDLAISYMKTALAARFQ